MDNNQRNMNAHQEARVAAAIWGNRYSKQNGGLMDFWDALPDGEKAVARAVTEDIRSAKPEKR